MPGAEPVGRERRFIQIAATVSGFLLAPLTPCCFTIPLSRIYSNRSWKAGRGQTGEATLLEQLLEADHGQDKVTLTDRLETTGRRAADRIRWR